MTTTSIDPQTVVSSARRWQFGFHFRRQLTGFSYTIPTLLFVVILFIVPLVLAGRMSLSSWGLLTGQGDVNFPKNFVSISKNQLFWPSVIFTLEYTVLVTVLLLGAGLGLALLVQIQSRWSNFLRTVFLLPVALGLATASLLAYGFFSPTIGPIGPPLESMGVPHAAVQFLGTPLTALLSTTFLIVWKYAGFYMLVLVVGLQGIPDDLYEAAALDGATTGQVFRFITLPLLRPSLALALILCITGSLLAFDQFFILTKGAPNNSTVTVVQVIYREAFQRQNLGTAAALSIIVMAVLLVLNAVQFRFLRGTDRDRPMAIAQDIPVRRSPRAFSSSTYYVLTGGLVIFFLFPLAWSVLASVMPAPGTAQRIGYGFANYSTLVTFGAGLPIVALNSVVMSVLTVVITLVMSTLGGYAFARFKFWGRDALFMLTLSILMVPFATLIIPLYVMLNAAGLTNSLLGVALIVSMFQLPFATYMMRISFEAVPRDLEESALIDGCGTFDVLWRIMMPSVRPGLVTVGLFAFLAAWNEYFAPLIMLTDPQKQTLPVAVGNLRQQTMGVIDYGATEAGVVVLAIPCVILFLLLQRYYVRGFMSGAVKG